MLKYLSGLVLNTVSIFSAISLFNAGTQFVHILSFIVTCF